MPNVRNKGIDGELEVRDLFRSYGFEAERGGQQSRGGSDKNPDVVHNIPDVHAEVKRAIAFSCLVRAMEQARKDAGNKIPTVWSRPDNDRGKKKHEWLVTLPASAFFSYLLGKEILK